MSKQGRKLLRLFRVDATPINRLCGTLVPNLAQGEPELANKDIDILYREDSSAGYYSYT